MDDITPSPLLDQPVAVAAAVASFPHGTVFVFDHDLRYVNVGGAHLPSLGRPRTDYVGRTLREMFDEEAAATREPYYRRALAGENVVFDAPLAGDRVLEMHLSPLLDGSGEVVAALGYTLDVTELRSGAQALLDSQEQFRLAFEKAPIGMALVSPDATVFQANEALGRILGRTALVGTRLGDLALASSDDLETRLQQLLAGDGDTFDLEMPWRRGDDGTVWVQVVCTVVRTGRDRRPSHVIAQVTDVTQRREQQEEIAAGHAFQSAVLVASPDVIHVRDALTGEVQWSSRAVTDVLGYTEEDVARMGDALTDHVVPSEDRARFDAAAMAARGVPDGEVVQVRHRAVQADGSIRWMSRRLTPFARAADGTVTHLLGISRDVTDSVALEQRLVHASRHDELTGLPNRRVVRDLLDGDGGATAVLFCDLDGFKRVNDGHGHAAGDAVLSAVAERLTRVVRTGDTVARLGGDEFVVVLRTAAGEDPERVAAQLADRVRCAVQEPIAVRGVEHRVGVSVGIAVVSGAEDADALLSQADHAMYLAKLAGRNART